MPRRITVYDDSTVVRPGDEMTRPERLVGGPKRSVILCCTYVAASRLMLARVLRDPGTMQWNYDPEAYSTGGYRISYPCYSFRAGDRRLRDGLNAFRMAVLRVIVDMRRGRLSVKMYCDGCGKGRRTLDRRMAVDPFCDWYRKKYGVVPAPMLSAAGAQRRGLAFRDAALGRGEGTKTDFLRFMRAGEGGNIFTCRGRANGMHVR